MRQRLRTKRRKKKQMKIDLRKIAALLASGITAICCIPFSAAADDLKGPNDVLTDGSFYYELNDDKTYTITRCTATIIDGIPSVRNGTAITAIGEGAFANSSAISDLVIPDSITTIGANAFYGCTSLRTVTLPKRL